MNHETLTGVAIEVALGPEDLLPTFSKINALPVAFRYLSVIPGTNHRKLDRAACWQSVNRVRITAGCVLPVTPLAQKVCSFEWRDNRVRGTHESPLAIVFPVQPARLIGH